MINSPGLSNEKTVSLDFLSSNENQAYHLFERAPAAIVILKGPEFVFELANTRALEIIGRTREEVIGRKLEEALPELSSQGYLDLIRMVINQAKNIYRRNHLLVSLLTEQE